MTVDYRSLHLEDILVSVYEHVAVVTLNRAKERNSCNVRMVNELSQVFDLFDRDDDIRVAVLTAEATAPAFCSGADISGGWDAIWDPESEREGEHAHRDIGGVLTLTILRCRKITIVAVNGNAAGMGITALQLPFDFRFVWKGSKLAFPFVKIGINPEGISTYLLPRLLGHSKANALLLSGNVIGPESSLLQGLYYEICPTREEVFPAALTFAKTLAATTAQVAVAYTKGLLLHPGSSPEENHMLDSRAIKLLASSGDAAEGAKAFKERRPARFFDRLSQNSSPWYPWWTSVDVRHRKAKL